MKQSNWLVKLVAAGLAAGTLGLGLSAQAAEKPQDPKVFNIGAILAMSGKADYYGTVMSQGILQAVDEINARGGVDGIKLKVSIGDNKSGSAQAGVDAMNRLIDIDHVEAVLTSFSPPTLAIAPIADQKKIFLINGGGVSQALIGASKYLFHNRSLASDLGRAALAYAHDQGWKKMATLAWNTDAGESIVKVTAPYWEKLGGTITDAETMNVGATNIDTQIAKIRASNPDFVALWLFSPDPGLAMKRIRQLGMKQPVVGIEYTSQVQKIGGKYMDGYRYFSDYFTPSASNPWSERFYKGYVKRYGKAPEFYAANYYEGVYVIADLIARARKQGGDYWRGDKLAAALRADPTLPSVYGGTMEFQKNGVAKKPVAMFVVKDGTPKFIKYVQIK